MVISTKLLQSQTKARRASGHKGLHYETLAICRTLALARASFEAAIAEKPAAGS